MTPLQLQMILHYHTRPTPYAEHEPEHAQSPAVRDQRKQLVNLGLLNSDWQTTDKGGAYVDFLCTMPIPVCKWVLP